MKQNVVIPLYITELPKASSLQMVDESLNKLNKAKKGAQNPTLIQAQAQSQAQHDSEPTLSEAGAWADNLIVSLQLRR